MTKEDLFHIFQINIQENAEVVLVLTHAPSVRLSYTCQFIFHHVLGVPFRVTDSADEFNRYGGPKLFYGTAEGGALLNIPAHPFMQETGVNMQFVPEIGRWNGLTVLFPFPASVFGFDLFSSVFYFISLYQEWQQFQPDAHGRFELKASLQYRQGEHLNPLVNVWIDLLRQKLNEHYPDFKLPEKKFRHISTIDVDNLYAYKNKGFLRSFLAAGKDLLRGDVKNLKRRWSVISGRQADPFDVYGNVIRLSEETGTPLIFFFLQRSGTRYDRTIDPSSGAFNGVFELLSKKGIPFGLHPSYSSFSNADILREEKEIISRNAGINVNISRQHYLRWDVKQTPALLEANGILADFTMGFASGAGYRAMTYTPFYYFDLRQNSSGNLLLVPFAVMDGTYFIYSGRNAGQAEDEMTAMAETIKKQGGTFVTVFHERTFDEVLYPGFGELYNRMHLKLRS